MVRTIVISRDHAKVAMPWAVVSVALASFQLLTQACNGQRPELSLIGQYFIHGRKCHVNVIATIEALVPSLCHLKTLVPFRLKNTKLLVHSGY